MAALPAASPDRYRPDPPPLPAPKHPIEVTDSDRRQIGRQVVGLPRRAENGVVAGRDARIPVAVLSGYLGPGKTTLLDRILTNRQGPTVTVIVNDMSEVRIDASIVATPAPATAASSRRP